MHSRSSFWRPIWGRRCRRPSTHRHDEGASPNRRRKLWNHLDNQATVQTPIIQAVSYNCMICFEEIPKELAVPLECENAQCKYTKKPENSICVKVSRALQHSNIPTVLVRHAESWQGQMHYLWISATQSPTMLKFFWNSFNEYVWKN